MFPPGAAPEEQAEQNVMWNSVIFWSALFWHLPLLAFLEGELTDGKSWLPGISVPDSPYRFRFRESVNASAFAAVIAGQLIPAEGIQWLSKNPVALSNLASALWNQHPAMPLIRSLMKQASEKTGAPLMKGKPAEIVSLHEGGAPENTANFRGSVSDVLSADVPREKTDQKEEDRSSSTQTFALVPGIDNGPQDINLPLKSSDSNRCEVPLSERGVSTGSTVFDVANDTDALLSLFDTPEEAKTDGCGEKLPTEEPLFLAKEVPSSERVEKNNDEKRAGLLLKENQDDSAVVFIHKRDERLHSVPVVISGTEVAEGKRFFDRLREGINRGDISFNGKEDKVHVIAGYVFYLFPVSFLTTSGPLVPLKVGKVFRPLLRN